MNYQFKRCSECGDRFRPDEWADDLCEVCACEHDDLDDHACCLTCGADRLEHVVASAEARYELER